MALRINLRLRGFGNKLAEFKQSTGATPLNEVPL
jgi:hypothetical protein